MTSMFRRLVPLATLGVLAFFAAPVEAANSTTVGTVTTAVASCNSVRVTASFTGDDNLNGTTTYQYGAGAAPAVWTGACTVSGASPRQCTVSGLTASTLYSFRASFADADGVVGTNPTVGVQATTKIRHSHIAPTHFGIILAAVAYFFSHFDRFLWLAFKIGGVTYGSLLGVFLLGLLTGRRCNRVNAAATFLTALVMLALLLLSEQSIFPLGWTWLLPLGTLVTFAAGWLLGEKGDRPAAS